MAFLAFNGFFVEQSFVFNLLVVPNSKEFRIMFFDQEKNTLKIKAHSKPIKGSANKEIEKKLSELFGTKTMIVSGQSCRTKKVLVENKQNALNFLKKIQ